MLIPEADIRLRVYATARDQIDGLRPGRFQVPGGVNRRSFMNRISPAMRPTIGHSALCRHPENCRLLE